MTEQQIDRRVSIAPMMDHTDRHFRYLMRLLSKNLRLYTEMITTGALIHGDRKRFLAFNPVEHPLAIQLGGSNPDDLAECARIAEGEGFDEVNLNIGCPSDRVQNGQFGVCLMAKPQLVADCVDRIKQHVTIPVTVKTRIGIDDQDSYEFLQHFIQTVHAGGCDTFILHARKALLQGLSPRENREIPPLNYQRVKQIKQDFPQLHITLNGGINNVKEMKTQLERVDGVMIGRMAYQNPHQLAYVDKIIFEHTAEIPTREHILAAYLSYVKTQAELGIRPRSLTRHIMGLYQGQPGARQFRRLLSNTSMRDKNNTSYLQDVVRAVSVA